MYDTLINSETLQKHIQDESWLIVDCRYDLTDPEAGYLSYQAGHIPGAVYIDLHKDLSRETGGAVGGRHPLPTEEEIRQLFTRLGIEEQTQVVVYDASFGAVAARFWWMLRYMGHMGVAVLDGGWQAWEKLGSASEVKENIMKSAPFLGDAQTEWRISAAQIQEAALLFDSREPARYRGEVEPMDPVAGHIPGAKNRFWKKNLDENGNFQAADQLKRQFLTSYGGIEAGQVVFYCGSGVTACHNVLAATYAGLPTPKLYAGSWSEWCADPGRPVATGEE